MVNVDGRTQLLTNICFQTRTKAYSTNDCIINCPMSVVDVALEPTSSTRWNQRLSNLPTPPNTDTLEHACLHTFEKPVRPIPKGSIKGREGRFPLWMGLTVCF